MQCRICGSEDHFAKDHPTESRYNRIRNGVPQSRKQGTSTIQVLSEVVNALREDENSSNSEPDTLDVTYLKMFYDLTSTYHLDNPTTSEEVNVTNHMDESKFQTHFSSTISTPPIVNVIPKKKVRFKHNSNFRQVM